MEFEAPPCQSIKRAATAPVEGQEATRLAGGRTGDGMTFYDSRPRAASACEVGDCGTDCATTANHDARARTHSSYLCQSWLPSSRAALVEGRRIRPRCRVRCRRGDPNFQSERQHARLARPANQCPLYPRKRTLGLSRTMSALCHVWTAPGWQEESSR